MIIFLICSFIFGTLIGSFLNVVILRLPKKETLLGRSHCMHCKHVLHSVDLIPIFSFLALAGKCRYCGAAISPRYFRIEVVTGLLFAFAYLLITPTDLHGVLFLLRAWFASAILLVIFMVDFEHYLILDRIVFPATIVLFLINLFMDPRLAMNGLVAGLGLFLFFGGLYYFSKGKWIGFGDVKLSFLLGQITPGLLIIINIFLAFGIGAVVSVGLILFKKKGFKSQIPFGTFLAISSIISLYVGAILFYWYVGAIGLGYLVK
jgi:leader peptidase (prepilin peptidase)/N-methyltransferase